jgi:hypothetical protein
MYVLLFQILGKFRDTWSYLFLEVELQFLGHAVRIVVAIVTELRRLQSQWRMEDITLLDNSQTEHSRLDLTRGHDLSYRYWGLKFYRGVLTKTTSYLANLITLHKCS